MNASETQLAQVPLFPLPNVVLFPRAVLPLHVFEERYKAMTADALAGDRTIAMALLRPGWEKCYYNRPTIEPIVCVGKILSHERLPDGKYNFLLEGTQRARIVSECHASTYRVAHLEPLVETDILEIDLSDQRHRLIDIFADEHFSFLPLVPQFQKMLNSPISTAVVADVIAFNLIENIQMKQTLLAETDVRRRVDIVIRTLEALRPLYEAISSRRIEDPSLN